MGLVIEWEDRLYDFIKENIQNMKKVLEDPENDKIMSRDEWEKYEINLLAYFKYFFAKC